MCVCGCVGGCVCVRIGVDGVQDMEPDRELTGMAVFFLELQQFRESLLPQGRLTVMNSFAAGIREFLNLNC